VKKSRISTYEHLKDEAKEKKMRKVQIKTPKAGAF
jgi:hypothetical protein